MNEQLNIILEYIEGTSGLSVVQLDQQTLKVYQRADSKVLTLQVPNIQEVLPRLDTDGKPFIQVNLINGFKLLMTDSLVGFRPAERLGLDMKKLPAVVTTPDLVGVIEALEDSLNEQVSHDDLDVLKKLFYSVLDGAESVGFDLSSEKSWLRQINRSGVKASA